MAPDHARRRAAAQGRAPRMRRGAARRSAAPLGPQVPETVRRIAIRLWGEPGSAERLLVALLVLLALDAQAGLGPGLQALLADGLLALLADPEPPILDLLEREV